ncbi:MRP-L47-domain-containing protein, partial [Saccharata proteae CBS 121410]
ALHTRPSSHAAHFLPSLVVPCTSSTACFSTSQPQCAKRRDGNPNRGVSAVRRTGLNKRQTLSVLKEKLPQPVHPDDLPDELKIETDPNHGLWGFFKDKKLLTTPKEEFAFGRAWSEVELRRKSWDDLHKLWWVCVKERNRIATVTHERQRLRAGYGEYEALERDATVHETQKNIRTVLLQRYYAFERSL